MIELTRCNNSDAVEADRLAVRDASAENLPFPDTTFTCATMTEVLGHLSNPVVVLIEMYRVLEIGGRIVIVVATQNCAERTQHPNQRRPECTFTKVMLSNGWLLKQDSGTCRSSVAIYDHPLGTSESRTSISLYSTTLFDFCSL
ncbi:class I SAM-dependent methyltransferase [Natrialba asiatica]|uniref:Methyltransferase type 11 n=1 Tax=Natrialba asiatica (strain ATCC 700177 / DSM 12278 / JCM 9576 / FERM P-10747 / NBRC 102637 / 172P1) TaxID=29540 RepID=M0B4Q4_NATA1|nr:methyltransferase type 11 [Natrialba asiatica DSM 12278]